MPRPSCRLALACLGLLAGLLAGGAPRPVAAQPHRATVVGVVTDTLTQAPVADASVFVAHTTRGTTTDDAGRFRLDALPPGTARLVVSMVGYKAQVRTRWLQAGRADTLRVALAPDTLALDAVTVTAPRDDAWRKHVARFREQFVGAMPEAARCSLTNPEALSFDTRWWGRLRAEARAPLVFVNRALGYRVRYVLTAFDTDGGRTRWDGEPHFTPLAPTGAAEAARWHAARHAAYYGSLRHFLHALLADSLDAAGFRLYRLPRARSTVAPTALSDRFPADRDRLLTPQGDSLVALDTRGQLEVVYTREAEDEGYPRWARRQRRARRLQVSRLALNEHPVHIDPLAAEIVEPYGVTVSGYLAYERLAHLLPRAFRPTAPPPRSR